MSSADSRIDRAPALFLSFTDDGRITFANTTLAERLGYTREEVIGKHVESLLTLAGRVFYQTHVFPLVRMHGSADEIFLLVQTNTGEQLGTLWNIVRRSGNHDEVCMECVVMEVRERRKYEDALLKAKRDAEAATERAEQQAVVLNEQAVELEMQHQQLQEQATELEAQADALRHANTELIKRGELLEHEREAARAAESAADAANHAKSEFLGTMSHELRTPLNAIGGYADLLATEIYGPVNEDQRHALLRVIRSQRHLLGLINDLLNLTRIEAGRVEYNVSNVALREIVDEVSEMITPQVALKRQTFDAAVGETIVLCADHEKAVQILINLLSNALKFTASGGHIELRSRLGDRAGFATIDVIDTGTGIPAQKLEAIFEPFIQVRTDMSRTNEGTGLGLAISRTLARGMGGDLTAVSELGRGSTFTLTLPLAPKSRD
ncbi:MAG TPA: PAS domain-containing sensor histidine kinase [Gemmatimonadaceae bacterium]|jgi:PAS domain S-box-containing protein